MKNLVNFQCEQWTGWDSIWNWIQTFVAFGLSWILLTLWSFCHFFCSSISVVDGLLCMFILFIFNFNCIFYVLCVFIQISKFQRIVCIRHKIMNKIPLYIWTVNSGYASSKWCPTCSLVRCCKGKKKEDNIERPKW